MTFRGNNDARLVDGVIWAIVGYVNVRILEAIGRHVLRHTMNAYDIGAALTTGGIVISIMILYTLNGSTT